MDRQGNQNLHMILIAYLERKLHETTSPKYTAEEERCAAEARRIFERMEPVEGRDYMPMPKVHIKG